MSLVPLAKTWFSYCLLSFARNDSNISKLMYISIHRQCMTLSIIFVLLTLMYVCVNSLTTVLTVNYG